MLNVFYKTVDTFLNYTMIVMFDITLIASSTRIGCGLLEFSDRPAGLVTRPNDQR